MKLMKTLLSYIKHHRRNIHSTYSCLQNATKHELTDDDNEFKSNVAPNHLRHMYVWGFAEHGALGYSTQVGNKRRRQLPRSTFNVPVRLHFGHYFNITDIACGYGFTLVATRSKDNNLKLFGCGLNSYSQIGHHDPKKNGSPLELILALVRIQMPFKDNKTKIIKLAAGRSHSIVVTTDGVYTFGNNSSGQCGRKIVQNEEYFKKFYCHFIKDFDNEKVIDAICGADHTMFLTETGKVYSCGSSANGQTGLDHFNNQDTPSLVKGDIEGEKIVKIACGDNCVLAINDKDEVFGWGNSEYGQLSSTKLQEASPRHLRQCSGFSRIIDVATSTSACIMLNDSGHVFSWGVGLLGRGPETEHFLKPTIIPDTLFGYSFDNDKKVVKLTSGPSMFGAITDTGQLFMWGKNDFGQLGIRSKKDQLFPLRVDVGAYVTKVCCGLNHTVALSKHLVS